MAETYFERETQQKFSQMTISSSSNNKNIFDDDNNITLPGSKISWDDNTTLKLPRPVVNESSDAGYGHIDVFPQALREVHMTFEDYENMECVPTDYEAETVACRLYYEKTLKELYERKDWPTGPNKANKQLSFVPPFLSKGLVSHIKLKVNRGKCKKKSCILSNRRQKNKVLRSTKLRKPKY